MLDLLDIAILEAVAAGRVSEVPEPTEDSGHTKWLVETGFIEAGRHHVALTDKGRKALMYANAIEHIVQHLEDNAQHVADIVVGPKREGWFNAESIVALWKHGVVVFGEQQYRTALKETACECLVDDSNKVPDVVAFLVRDEAEYDVAFVIEAKVLYRSEDEREWARSIGTLKDQLTRAKRCCPSAGAIGVLYLVAIVDHEVGPNPFFSKVQAMIGKAFEDSRPTILREAEVLQGLGLRPTSFAYPSTTVSIGLAAFYL